MPAWRGRGPPALEASPGSWVGGRGHDDPCSRGLDPVGRGGGPLIEHALLSITLADPFTSETVALPTPGIERLIT